MAVDRSDLQEGELEVACNKTILVQLWLDATRSDAAYGNLIDIGK